jgi:hypothetical protein
MLLILLRIKNHSGDEGILRSELHQLCGDLLLDVVEVVLNNRHSLVAEFQVKLSDLFFNGLFFLFVFSPH